MPSHSQQVKFPTVTLKLFFFNLFKGAELIRKKIKFVSKMMKMQTVLRQENEKLHFYRKKN